MEENFHKSERLGKEKMHQLIQKSNQPALLRFVIMYTLFIFFAVGVVYSWNGPWWQVIISQAFFGMMMCSLFAAEHETVHNTAFKSLTLNKIAAFMAGLGYLYPASIFRELHFTHHRHTHVPGLDPEISLGGKPGPSVVGSLPFYLVWLSGFPLFFFKIGMLINGALGMPEPIRKNIYPFIDPKARGNIAIESWIILSVHLVLLYIAIYVNPSFWAFYVGLIVGHCFLASYTAPEHNGLPHDTDDILEKTRSIRCNKFVKALMWNMPYHAEHHAYPSVPFHALPELHTALYDELKHKEKNHPAFHFWVLKKTTIGDK